jgi:signal transduction histidine kinase
MMNSIGSPPVPTAVPYHSITAADRSGDFSKAQARLLALVGIYCEAAAITVVTIGFIALYGWALQIGWMKSVVPGLVEMKANTAFGLIFASTSYWLLVAAERGTRRFYIGRLLALLTALIGLVTGIEYLTGWNLHIDEMIFSESPNAIATSSPGRMAPATVVSFVAIGLALPLLDWEPRRDYRPAQWLGLFVGLVAMLAIAGYIYNVPALYSSMRNVEIALNTAVALFLLSGAVLFARPRCGIARVFTGSGSGSQAARRFLPAVFLVPLVLGWLLLQGELAGYYGMEFGLALFTTASAVVFAVLTWLSAGELNAEHERRNRAEAELRDANASLEARVAERTATLQLAIQELRRSNEELAQFANIASHDLQEPLRMVASYTQLLARRYKGKLDADADDFINFAVDGAERMQRLIHDLLAYSKIGVGEPVLGEVSGEKALQQALANLKRTIEDSAAEVTHDPLPVMQADETQLIQLFQNLIGNGIKYQSAGNVPKIHVTAAKEGKDGEDGCVISVSDNGIGIEPRYFERIFGMFERLHKRDEYAGTGIGLAMCKKIVERWGGAITVKSQPGKGSIFTFTLAGRRK